MSYKEARRRLAERRRQIAEAKGDWQEAQKQYEKAKRLDLPAKVKLRDARDKALAKLRGEKRWLKKAEQRVELTEPLDPELTRISPNKSSRGGVKPRLIVLHITVSHNRPGTADVAGILAFFQNRSVMASSHIVNDREGNDGRCVRDADKAWTQAAYNPQALSVEQIEFDHTLSRSEWLMDRRPQLDNTAEWVAYWSHKWDIPLRHSTQSGVCQHRDLGAAGGGHVDCSPSYPIDYVLDRALRVRRAKYGH